MWPSPWVRQTAGSLPSPPVVLSRRAVVFLNAEARENSVLISAVLSSAHPFLRMYGLQVWA